MSSPFLNLHFTEEQKGVSEFTYTVNATGFGLPRISARVVHLQSSSTLNLLLKRQLLEDISCHLFTRQCLEVFHFHQFLNRSSVKG